MNLSAILGLAWLAGILGHLHSAALQPVPLYMRVFALALLSALGMLRYRHRAVAAPLLIASVIALAWSYGGLRAHGQSAEPLAPALEGQTLLVRGRILSMPQAGSQPRMQRFLFAVESAEFAARPVQLPARLQLNWYRAPESLQAGQIWQLALRLKAPHGSLNPEGFDYEAWLFERGIGATGYVYDGRRAPAPRLLGNSEDWLSRIERARQKLREKLTALNAPRAAALLAALASGDQGGISEGDWELYRASGIVHLVSVSGLHITIFAWLAFLLATSLWRRSVLACLWLPAQAAGWLVAALLAGAYALFTGWAIPAQRAYLMFLLFGVARHWQWNWPWPLVMLLVAFLVALWDPWALLQPGFWLSFASVALLFGATPSPRAAMVAEPEPRTLAARLWCLGKGSALRALHSQWAMLLGLAPLTLLFFQQISLVGFLTNAAAIPFVTLWLQPLALLGALHPIFWQWAAWSIAPFHGVLEILARQDWAVWQSAARPLWCLALLMFALLLLLLRLPRSVKMLVLPLALPFLLWRPSVPPWGEFVLLLPDIGQGSAAIVQTSSDSLIYDAGPKFGDSDAGGHTLLPLLRAQGLRPERLILSHNDSDHSGGALSLLRVLPMPTPTSLLSGQAPPAELAHLAHVARSAAPCYAGLQWQSGGVQFALLHPHQALWRRGEFAAAAPAPGEKHRARHKSNNDTSCVLRISSASGRVALLTGDISVKAEREILARLGAKRAGVRADLLVLAHHGSRTSSGEEFLEAVRPQWAFAQVGYRNRYRHPAAQVQQRLVAHRIPLLTSVECGAFSWRSWRAVNVAEDCERHARSRYWHHHPTALAQTTE